MIQCTTANGMRDHDPQRRLVLRAGRYQVLWALFLVYMILTGIALLFGREVGYEISFGVCGGLAALITAAFAVIFAVDRASAASGIRLRRFRKKSNRGIPRNRSVRHEKGD